LILPRVQVFCVPNLSIMSIHYFETFGTLWFFKPPIPILQTTKRRPFHTHTIICLFNVLFSTIIYHGSFFN
jgi:hypothetical protein